MITTLLFDLGGTLHDVRSTDESRRRFSEHLIRRLGQYGIVLDTDPDTLSALLRRNAEDYKQRGERDLTELPEAEVWNDWYLKDFHIGRERLEPIAEELSFLYDYKRVENMRKARLKETVETLRSMGIRLGVVSNIISTSLVPHVLNEYGIAKDFECIVMSSSTGIRKPDPRIFEITMDKMGVTAAETGYVGDTISRDVRGARNAHMGLVIQVNNPAIAHRDVNFRGPDAPKPDYLIQELYEIPPIIERVNA